MSQLTNQPPAGDDRTSDRAAGEVSRERTLWRWSICILLFLATVLSYLDRQTMAICSNAICEEFGLSNEQLGELQAAFRWTYAAVQFPAGWLADRCPVRATYALAVGVWSLAGAAAAWVSSPQMLARTRAMLGVGEAFNTPCALRTTSNVLPPEDRALGNGLFNCGAATGALAAPFMIAPVAEVWGWRRAFLLVGAAGAAWIVLWLVFTRSRTVERRKEIVSIDVQPGRTGKWRLSAFSSVVEKLVATLGRPMFWLQVLSFWLLVIFSITINPCWYFCADWIPKYMHDQRGFANLGAGLITIPVFLAADAGNLSGGAIVKLLAGRGWSLRRARAASSLLAAALVLPVIAAGHVANPYGSIALLASAAFGIMALMTNYLASIQAFSLARVGLVAGILGAVGNVAGAVASPLIGRYVDQSGNYHAVFLLVGIASSVGMAAMVAADALVAKTTAHSEAK